MPQHPQGSIPWAVWHTVGRKTRLYMSLRAFVRIHACALQHTHMRLLNRSGCLLCWLGWIHCLHRGDLNVVASNVMVYALFLHSILFLALTTYLCGGTSDIIVSRDLDQGMCWWYMLGYAHSLLKFCNYWDAWMLHSLLCPCPWASLGTASCTAGNKLPTRGQQSMQKLWLVMLSINFSDYGNHRNRS